MYCSKCGAQVVENAVFCGTCGQPTAAGQPAPVYSAGPTGAVATVAGRPVAYAGFWLRLVALIIDMILVGVLGTILTLPLVAALGLRAAFGPWSNRFPMRPDEAIALIGTFFWIIVARMTLHWLYYAIFESSAWQATPGKKALGLEVTDLEGRRISFGRASGRLFGKIISAMILWIGFIMAGLTERKQALHDMMAGCLVIKKV